MAAMTAALPMLTAVGQGIALFSDTGQRTQDNALGELKAKQNAQMGAMQQNAALDRAKIGEQSAQSDKARRDALKRAVARQRAKFGSSGISAGTGGSSEAVLLGMFEESDGQRSEREKLDSLRLRAIDQNIAQQNSFNVLQRTQLQQRQNLSNISSGNSTLNKISRGINIVGSLF